jgi:KipI family sensor histidine kinase inhibitor
MISTTIEALGDRALLLRLGDTIDASLNRRVLALAAHIEAHRPAWMLDCVPTYASLAIFIDHDAFTGSPDPLIEAEAWLRHTVGSASAVATDSEQRVVEIPVHYGDDDGPDLLNTAGELNITPDELIARHVAPLYRVAMLGFAPGFPYLLGLDPALNAPRLATPRTSVPAGSVGIGGSQTGIYPCVSPGGWRLIGRTPLSLFDADRDPPSLLLAGDRVRFVPS